MIQDWEIKKLDDLCQIELGKTPYRGDKSFWDTEKKTDNVWLSIADLLNTEGDIVFDSKEYITDKAAKISKVVKAGTLLLSFKLTLGRLAFAGKDLFTNEAIAALTIKNEKVIDKYFLYQFLSFYDWSAATEGDVKVKGKTLNKAKLKEIVIRFPKSLSEQQQIVTILKKVFAIIDKTKENTEKNLKNATDFFKAYLYSIFSNPKSSWKRMRIDEVCESIIDCVNKTAPKLNEITPFKMIRTTNVKNGLVNLDLVNYVTEDVYRVWTRRQVPKRGDIILTREAPMGEVGMLLSDERVFLGQRLVSYRVSPRKLNNKFLLYAFQSSDLQNQISALASGSTVQHMRVPDSKALQLNVPPLSEQQSYVTKLDIISSHIEQLKIINQKKRLLLIELKRSIFQKAFSGQLARSEVTCD